MSGFKDKLSALSEEYTAQAYPGDLAELLAEQPEPRRRASAMPWLAAAAALAATVAIAAWLGGRRDAAPDPTDPEVAAVGEAGAPPPTASNSPTAREAKPVATGIESRLVNRADRPTKPRLALPAERSRPSKPTYRPRVDRGLVDWRRPLPGDFEAKWIGVTKLRPGRQQRFVSLPPLRTAPAANAKSPATELPKQVSSSNKPTNAPVAFTKSPPTFSPRLRRVSTGLSLAEGLLRKPSSRLSLRRTNHGV